MIKRILLHLFVAWLAVAPAIASSCAAGCDILSSVQHAAHEHGSSHAQSNGPDCHGDHDGTQVPDEDPQDDASMTAACFVASAVTLPACVDSAARTDSLAQHDSFMLVPSATFETFPPDKPPQT